MDALAAELCSQVPALTAEVAADVAKCIYEMADLVPLGLGDAIVEAYKEHFAEALGG